MDTVFNRKWQCLKKFSAMHRILNSLLFELEYIKNFISFIIWFSHRGANGTSGKSAYSKQGVFSLLNSTAIRPQYRFHRYQRFGPFSQRGALINKEKVWGSSWSKEGYRSNHYSVWIGEKGVTSERLPQLSRSSKGCFQITSQRCLQCFSLCFRGLG